MGLWGYAMSKINYATEHLNSYKGVVEVCKTILIHDVVGFSGGFGVLLICNVNKN